MREDRAEYTMTEIVYKFSMRMIYIRIGAGEDDRFDTFLGKKVYWTRSFRRLLRCKKKKENMNSPRSWKRGIISLVGIVETWGIVVSRPPPPPFEPSSCGSLCLATAIPTGIEPKQ